MAAGRCRPWVPRVGAAGEVARWAETAIAFARLCLCGVETAVAFAGEIWAFSVQFSDAEVMPVSVVSCWGRAEVLLVSMSPCLCVLCAKYFAMRAQNTPISVFLRLLGEFFRGTAAVGAVWGEFFAELLWTGACCASFFAELPPEGPCWASFSRTGSRWIPPGAARSPRSWQLGPLDGGGHPSMCI